MGARKAKRGRGGRRPGAGRKPIFRDHADRTVRFERDVLGALDTLAEEQGVTTADLVREAVRVYLTRRRS